MTHPVEIDALLERYEYAPHEGSPAWVATRVGRKVVVDSACRHAPRDAWTRAYHLQGLSSRPAWFASRIDGRWSNDVDADWLERADVDVSDAQPAP